MVISRLDSGVAAQHSCIGFEQYHAFIPWPPNIVVNISDEKIDTHMGIEITVGFEIAKQMRCRPVGTCGFNIRQHGRWIH